MIIFEKIRWKNLLATGNAFIEIPLNQNNNTLFVGENGSGKSTILDALVFVLFGKPYRNIRKPTLVNSINKKNCLAEIEFSTNGRAYKVRRGIKPTIFEIYCDGICLNQDSDSRDYQEYLEKNILKMSLKTFTQIVILGSASFTPFMQLNALDRRTVIENVTDTEIFSRMGAIIKSRLQANMEALDKNNIELSAAEDKKAFIQKTLDRLRSTNKERVDVMKKDLDDKETMLDRLRDAVKELGETRDRLMGVRDEAISLLDKHKKAVQMHAKLEASCEHSEKESAFFENNDTCPTCTQKIDETFKKTKLFDLQTRIENIRVGMSEVSETIRDMVNKIDAQNKQKVEIEKIGNEIKLHTSKIEGLVSFINTTRDEIDRMNESDALIASSQAEYDAVLGDIVLLQQDKKQLLDQKLYIETAQTLLKDGGIKSKIIRTYLPIINKLINHYLGLMGFSINFTLNDQFEEKILSRYHEDFSYESYSEGQKLRIDLSILFAWRGIAKKKNSVDCNLLVIDEIFDSSLDGNGTDEFIKIMQTLVDKTNIFIISHKQDQLIDKFEKVYRFVTIKKFTKLVI